MIAVTAIKDLQLETSINDAYICLLKDSIGVAENRVSNNHSVRSDPTSPLFGSLLLNIAFVRTF